MKKAVPVILFAVLVAVFGFQVRSADAYSQYSTNGSTGNCASCHGDFNGGTYTSLVDGQSWGSNLHDVHRNGMLNGDCDVCHSSGGRSPVLLNSSVGGSGLSAISCVGCHGRNEDVTPNDGAFGGSGPGRGDGLRAHHAAAGVGACAVCHTADTVPVGEDVLPPYYANPGTSHPNMPTDPCNLDGNENFAGSARGLDNDGDDLYDGADPDCQAAAAPQVAVTPALKDYGNVEVGSSSNQVFTISNTGTADLIVSGIALATGSNYSVAVGGSNACPNLTPTIVAGDNCTVQVTFSPLSVGNNITDTLSITSNDTGNSPLTVPQTGNGVAPPTPTPNIAVTDSVAPGNDLLVPFGSITIGTTSDQTVTVTNNGTADLVIGAVASANPLAAPFSIQGNTCSAQTLAPSATCTITVRFAPNSTAPASDSFDIPSDDPDTPAVTVSVSGTGTGAPAPNITVTDSVAPGNDLLVAFGNVLEGSASDQTVTVTNNGTANLLIGNVASANPLAAPFSIPSDTCSAQNLTPGDNCTITVQFAPTASGAANDTFDIPSDDPDEPTVTVTVSGTGVANNPPAAPALVIPADGATGVNPASVTFGWNRSTDEDGDPVTYDLYLCPDDDTFATCPDPVNTEPIATASRTKAGLAFAASGVGLIFFGVAFVPGIGRRRKAALLLVLALAAGLLLVACSNDDEESAPRGQVSFTSTNLAAGTTYYWKVVATDGTDSTDSETRSFTTK